MLSNIKYFRQLEFIDHKSYNTYQRARNMNYQFPSLVMFAEGDIFFKAAGMFPENDGSTETKRHYIWLATSSHLEWIICHFKKTFLSNWESRTKKHLPKNFGQAKLLWNSVMVTIPSVIPSSSIWDNIRFCRANCWSNQFWVKGPPHLW